MQTKSYKKLIVSIIEIIVAMFVAGLVMAAAVWVIPALVMSGNIFYIAIAAIIYVLGIFGFLIFVMVMMWKFHDFRDALKEYFK